MNYTGRGESELAWLDQVVDIQADRKNAVAIANQLMKQIYEKIVVMDLPIGHLKFILDDGSTKQKFSYTASGGLPVVDVSGISSSHVTLLVNARVQTTPGLLSAIVQSCFEEMRSQQIVITSTHLRSFKPAMPQPLHRMP